LHGNTALLACHRQSGQRRDVQQLVATGFLNEEIHKLYTFEV
jgi:hypothetical protein